MLEAGREIHEQKVKYVDGISQCGVSCDGTWHKRGHSSMNGCVAALSMETGKCLDVEVLSKVCHGCQGHENQQDTEEKRVWQVEHVGKCKANYTGSELSKSFSASLQFAWIHCFLRSLLRGNLKNDIFRPLSDRDVCTGDCNNVLALSSR